MFPSEVVRDLLAGRYPAARSQFFIHNDERVRDPYDLLDPAAVPLIDPETGTAPVDAPRRTRKEAEEVRARLNQIELESGGIPRS